MVKNKRIRNIISLLLVFIMGFSTLSMTGCMLFEDQYEVVEEVNNGDTSNNDNTTQEPEEVVPMVDPISDDYRVFYHIFVGSFSDSNNDTIGDLRGVINRMDYLNDGDINSGNDLGVQGIWLSPIFSSPSYHKYDASDYYKIDWRFGNEDTLKELIELAHSRNVKVIIDLAINHTSNQHPWFKEFKQARIDGDTSNKYYNYYSCATENTRENGKTYQKIAGVDCYFECNFTGDMPELNYDNPEVKAEMLAVAKYYLDLGIDGFRYDAVKYIYFNDTNRSVAFWNWYNAELRAYKPDIYLVGECWSGDNEVVKYYGSMNCFNFSTAGAEGKIAVAAKGSGFTTYLNYIESYQDSIKNANKNAMMCAFLSNHDMDRIAGTFINSANMKMAANLYLLAHGSPFIYYGEELGMRGSRASEATDANRRLAMLWGDGDRVKNPTGYTYPSDKQITTTVASQLEDPNSLLNHYAKVIAVRNKYEAIARGDYNAVTSSNSKFGGFYVTYKGEVLGIFHNVSTSSITIDINKCSGLDGNRFTQLLEVLGSSAKLEGNMLTIAANTSVILK